jgi:hypothetical protein
LFGKGWELSLVYIVIFILFLVIEVLLPVRSRKIDAAFTCVLVLFFPVTFWVARCAGVSQANKDRGEKTSLPTVTFTADACGYGGKVVYVKGDSLYVYNLAYFGEPAKPATCPFVVGSQPSIVPQLWLLRSGDLKDVRVVHYEKEAKPWLCCANKQ